MAAGLRGLHGMASLAVALLCATSSIAQDLGSLPGAVQKNSIETKEFYERQQQLDEAKRAGEPQSLIEREPPAGAKAADSSGETIFVSSIEVGASAALTPEDLKHITSPYENRAVSLADLNSVVDQINALYQRRGYITARAVLPPQKIEGGVVHIRLIEARVDQVIVRNNAETSERFILSQVDVHSGELVRLGELDRKLVKFNLTHDVKLRARLEPGSRPETSNVVLTIYEPDKVSTSMFLDNAGRQTIGQNRVGLQFSNESLTGYRDRFAVGGSYASGTDTAYANYSRTVNRHGTVATIAYDYSRIDIVNGELKDLDVTGESSIASISLSHPILADTGRLLYGSAGVNVKESTTDFGRVDSFNTSVRSISLGAEYQWFGTGYVFSAHPSLDIGVDQFGGDRNFRVFDADLTGLVNVGRTGEVVVRLRGQLSDTNQLPSTEQFQLGGVATIRGYQDVVVLGDQGYFVSAAYRHPLPLTAVQRLVPVDRNSLKASVFVDHGGAFTSASGDALDVHEYLSSAGVGLLYEYRAKFYGSLQVAWPFGNQARHDDDFVVHFAVNYSAF